MSKYIEIENESKVFCNGSKWTSNKCGKFTIIGKTNRTDSKSRYVYYLCQFDDGTIVEYSYSHIRDGYVKNPNHPSLHGVGVLGVGKWSCTENGEKTKEYITWSEMIRRCYAKNASKKFPAYIGVTVCDRWHNFQLFCEDIKSLDGYEEYSINDGYHLDKDFICEKLNIHPKIYSPDTCIFLDKATNVGESTARRNLTGLTYKAISPTGETYTFLNQMEFAKEHGLSNSLICECLKGVKKSTRGWTFITI